MRAIICAGLAALALVLLTGTGSAKPVPPGAVKYDITYTGLVFVKGNDTGTTQNASCQQNNGIVPFQKKYSMRLAWTATFQVAFNPNSASTSGYATAKTTNVHGSSYSYSGYSYDDNCQKQSWGPGGQACTGTMINHGKALIIVRETKVRGYNLRIDIQPFGALTASGTCMDTAGNTIDVAGDLSLAAFSNSLSSHVFSTRETLGKGVSRTKDWNIDRVEQCAQASGGLPGESEQCSVTTTGAAILSIHPFD